MITKLFSILTERFTYSDKNKVEDMKLLIKELLRGLIRRLNH